MRPPKLNSAILSCDVALFTGAGASVPLGLPDTKTFVNQLDGDLRSTGSSLASLLASAIAKIGEGDVEVLLDALADWLTDLSKAKDVPAPGHESPMDAALTPLIQRYAELRTHVLKTVVSTYGRVRVDAVRACYDSLLVDSTGPACLRRKTLPIFTTNYDTAIEALAQETGRSLGFVDGFRRTAFGLRWSADRYHKYKPGTRTGPDIVLFKLHGSSNWYRTEGGAIEKVDNFDLDPGQLKTIMIFPTQKKAQYLGTEPFDTSYGYFKACLMKLKLLIVVGFSFRDAEIRQYVWDALRTRSDFALLVIDPGFTRETLLERISGGEIYDIKGTVEVVPARFGKPSVLPAIDEFWDRLATRRTPTRRAPRVATSP